MKLACVATISPAVQLFLDRFDYLDQADTQSKKKFKKQKLDSFLPEM